MFWNSDAPESRLKFAVKNNDAAAVKTILNEHPAYKDITIALGGKTALHLAAKKGYLKVVDVLIEAGANVDRADNECATALHFAVSAGHPEVVKTLVKHGASPQARKYAEDAIIEIVIRKDQGAIMEAIAAGGFDVKPYLKKAQHAGSSRCVAVIGRQFAVDPKEDIAAKAEEKIASVAAIEKQEGLRGRVEKNEKQLADERRLGKWTLTGEAEITHERDVASYHLTDVFNFTTRERTTLWRDPSTSSVSRERIGFDDMKDKSALEQAWEKLDAAGASIDPQTIHVAVTRRQLRPLIKGVME